MQYIPRGRTSCASPTRMTSDATIFTLESATKRGPGNYVCMRSPQLNARAVGRVFNLSPQTVFLVADDGSVELPDEDGSFNVDNMDTSRVWTCNGDSSKPAVLPNQWLRPISSGGRYLSEGRPITEGRIEQRTRRRSCGSEWIKRIEICDLQSSVLKKLFNLPVSLTEQSATVSYIVEFVSEEAFDGAAVVLLDSENLKIPDTIGTRGVHSSPQCALNRANFQASMLYTSPMRSHSIDFGGLFYRITGALKDVGITML